MKRLYIVRIEWSQTDHEHIGIWAHSAGGACKTIEQRYPGAYYYSTVASTAKILE